MTYDEMVTALVAERKRLGLTQYDLADRMGIGQNGVWKLETRKINRSNMITLSRWATALRKHIRIEFILEDLNDGE